MYMLNHGSITVNSIGHAEAEFTIHKDHSEIELDVKGSYQEIMRLLAAARDDSDPKSPKLLAVPTHFAEELTKFLMPGIKKVIFHDPATIVYWDDDVKTVVKCNGEKFDAEKGLAMAISKRILGNKGNFNEVFKKNIPEELRTKPKKKRSKKTTK